MSVKPFCKTSNEVLAHIDGQAPCFVYRNLHKNCLSIKQRGIVKCHAENVVLTDCEFKVSDKGRDRVRAEKKKNVHAGVKGYVVDARWSLELLDFEWANCYYNPYTTDYWKIKDEEQYIDKAGWVDLNCDKLGASVLAFDILYKCTM